MAIEAAQFKIVPDAERPGRWAYEAALPGRQVEAVGGFSSPGLSPSSRRTI
ncbi:hypothetical protein V5F53_20665 [Xanthobacter sp. V4C-4]|uniref:hypothetical protein n=1 Tax=Xanthobacter cornucopiae TaxID=3119924 RepID=UPI003726D4B1